MQRTQKCIHFFVLLLVVLIGFSIYAIHAECRMLIPPFQNLSKTKAMIEYEVATNNDPNNPKRYFQVDQYSEAPREILEDILVNMGGSVVERQRLDTILLEGDFGRFSGLVDMAEAVKLGKLLGADRILMGSILNISTIENKFSGNAIRVENIAVTCTIRIRLIHIESGSISLSKEVTGGVTRPSSNFGSISDSDVAFTVIQETLEQLRNDDEFRKKLVANVKQENTSMIDIQFSPIPENSDIFINDVFKGNSPIVYPLPSGQEIRIRIQKAGFQAWEQTIVPEDGLVVKPELLKIAD